MNAVTIDDLKTVFAKILWGHDKCDEFVTLLMGSGIPAPGHWEQFDILDDGDRYQITLINSGTRFKVQCEIYRNIATYAAAGPRVVYGGCPTEWQTRDGSAFAGLMRLSFLNLVYQFDGVLQI